jgi:hypothetical protein
MIAPSVAICWPENSKLCALFFDHISIIDSMWLAYEDAPKEVLIPNELLDREVDHMANMIKEARRAYDVADERIKIIDDSTERLLRNDHDRRAWFGNVFIQYIRDLIQDPLVPFFRQYQTYSEYQNHGKSDALEVKLVNIGVINISNLEWDQVLEIRRDPDSNQKLRRFRLFMTEQYKDKDENYIKDDLLLRIHEYEKVCKKHGLELIISSVSKILDAKSLMGIAATSAAGSLLSNPDAGILSGVAIAVGQVAIHIAQKRLDFKTCQDNAEIAYLMDIREKCQH